MKKNNMLRIASVLLVAVLLSTCAISGAFAKYITTGPSVTDGAQVAAWGVEIDASEDAAFAKEETATVTDFYTDDDTKMGLTVKSDAKVVAPGTSGNLGAFTVSGTPEVAVNVKTTAELTLENWEVGGAFYCPIVFTIGGTPINGADYNNVDDLIDAVEAAIAIDVNYEAGTSLSDARTYTWAWAIDGDGVKQTDAKDTALGNQAAGIDGGVAATISLTVQTTVTQIDK